MRRSLLAIIVAGSLFIVTVSVLHIALGQSWIPGTIPVTPSLDSEHRFYASIFLMYGVALGWVARDLDARRPTLHFLLVALFVGGLARIVSAIVAGWPHPLFVALGIVELLLPPLLFLLSARERLRHQG